MMGNYDDIATPVSRQPISASQYGIPMLAAVRDLDSRMTALDRPVFLRKQGNTDRAVATMTLDPDLQFVADIGAVYEVQFHMSAGALSAAGFQTSWTVPAGTSGSRQCIGPASGETDATNAAGRFGVHNMTTTVSYGTRNSQTQLFYAIERSIVGIGGTGGVVGINWGQATANATPSRMGGGSYGIVTRVG